jgi:hypothetical protein
LADGWFEVDFASINSWNLFIQMSKNKVLPSLFGEGPGEGLLADGCLLRAY